MPSTTLVDVAALHARLGQDGWAVVDCRYSLDDAERGEADYLQAHVPGAAYAHVDRDLSAPVVPGVTGRHPLPDPVVLAETLGRLGIGPGVQVVAYDDAGGAIASRLWWLLGWMGHGAAAVLDGGWGAWLAAGMPVAAGRELRPRAGFAGRPRPELVAGAREVEVAASDASAVVLDARSPDRYRGENETIDPVAGHLPGAVSVPYAGNLDGDGRFLPPELLRVRYEEALAGVPASAAIAYCGSGVTATHDLLAMAHAGLPGARLYAGSWSEWITDAARPIALGDGA